MLSINGLKIYVRPRCLERTGWPHLFLKLTSMPQKGCQMWAVTFSRVCQRPRYRMCIAKKGQATGGVYSHGRSANPNSSCLDYLIKGTNSLRVLTLIAGGGLNLAITKQWEKPEEWLKLWHMGTHLRVLSKRYPMNTNMTGCRWFSKIFAFLCFGRK